MPLNKLITIFIMMPFFLDSCSKERTHELQKIGYENGSLIIKTSFRGSHKELKKILSKKLSTKIEIENILSYKKKNSTISLSKISFNADSKLIEEKLSYSEHLISTSRNTIYSGNPMDEGDSGIIFSSPDPIPESKRPLHKLLKSEQVWQVTQGEGIDVAVTDNGVDYKHFDLKDNIYLNEKETCGDGLDNDENNKLDDCYGWNFIDNDNDPSPSRKGDYHGTHVSGIIASTRNGKGSVGVAPRAKILPLKFIGDKTWTSLDVMNSYAYALRQGVKIINTSYNIDMFVDDEVYIEALSAAEAYGAIVVNSAGNSGEKDPARGQFENMLLVANTRLNNPIRVTDKLHPCSQN